MLQTFEIQSCGVKRLNRECEYVSCCGRYHCALCDYHKGTIVKAAKKLLPLVETHNSLRIMADLYGTCNFNEFVKGLRWLASKDKPCKGCRFGGGWSWWPDCPVRNCTIQRGVQFCYQCEEFPCKKLSEEPMLKSKKGTIEANYQIRSLGIENWLQMLKRKYES